MFVGYVLSKLKNKKMCREGWRKNFIYALLLLHNCSFVPGAFSTDFTYSLLGGKYKRKNTFVKNKIFRTHSEPENA